MLIEYHDYLNVFSKKKKIDEMPFHRKHNYVIELLHEKIDFEHASFYNMFEN